MDPLVGDDLDTALARRLNDEAVIPLDTLQRCLEDVRSLRAVDANASLALLLLERRLIPPDALQRASAAVARPLPKPPSPAQEGQLGDYRIERELARGGMGVVHQAVYLPTGTPVAIKSMFLSLSGEGLLRFRREAELLASLDHPNVVRVRTADLSGQQPYLVQDLMPGGSLQDRIDQAGPLAWQEAVVIVARLADALHYVHQLEIVHRDLKPANVLFDDRGEPRLADFGLASVGERDRLTLTGELLGTPAYMAPEQVRCGKSVGPAADIYGLGGVLYAALTGRPPFPREQPWKVIEAVLHQMPPPPRSFSPELPTWVEAVCLRALSKQPGERFADAAAMARALRGTGTRRLRPRRHAGAAVLLLGGVIALAAVAALASAPPPTPVPSAAATSSPRAGRADLADPFQILAEEGPSASRIELCVEQLLERPDAALLATLPASPSRTYLTGVLALLSGDPDEALASSVDVNDALARDLRLFARIEQQRATLPSAPYASSQGGLGRFWKQFDADEVQEFLDSSEGRLATVQPGALRSWASERVQDGVARVVVATQLKRPKRADNDARALRIGALLDQAEQLPGGGGRGRDLLAVARLYAVHTLDPTQRPRLGQAALTWSRERIQFLPGQIRHPLHAIREAATREGEHEALWLAEQEAALDAVRGDLLLTVRHVNRLLPYAATVTLVRLRDQWAKIQAEGPDAAAELLPRLREHMELARLADQNHFNAEKKELLDRRSYQVAWTLLSLLEGESEALDQALALLEEDPLHSNAVLRAERELVQGKPRAALELLQAACPPGHHAYVGGQTRPDLLTTRAHAHQLLGQDEYARKDLGRAYEVTAELAIRDLDRLQKIEVFAWLPWRTPAATQQLVEGQGWWPGAAAYEER